MEDKLNELKEKITSDLHNSIKAFKIVNGLEENPTIQNYQINKKIQKKLLKVYIKENHNNSNSNLKKYEISAEEGKNKMIKKKIFPWGIAETNITIEKK